MAQLIVTRHTRIALIILNLKVIDHELNDWSLTPFQWHFSYITPASSLNVCFRAAFPHILFNL